MKIISKLKNILFDEEFEDLPERTDELPERDTIQIKKDPSVYTRSGIIDHSTDEEDINDEIEEDIIKEVKVPKEEKTIDDVVSDYIRPDSEFETNEVTREFDIPQRRTHEEVVIQPRRDYSTLIKNDIKVNKSEKKDYHKLIENKTDENTGKKPFKVTPVISPVYGVINETKQMEQEYVAIPIKKENIEDNKNRKFGPVSFNDTPLPVKQKVEEKIEETYSYNIEEELEDTVQNNIEELLEKEIPSYSFEEDAVTESIFEENEDIEISSPDYDDLDEIETSGIEEEYINNTVEDAFESTTEYETIEELDKQEEKTEDIIKEVVNTEEDEDAHLDDTIETDLFNLIDSMYKDDDEEIEEDE